MKNEKDIQIEPEWKNALNAEFEKPYFQEVWAFLLKEINEGKKIYPPLPLIFEAFNKCPFNDTKVVVLGQDPYHGPNQAHGLSFSVNKGLKIPPSLQNIYKELKNDLGLNIPTHGCLIDWSAQGVLLLNSTLTVEHKSPASHNKKGWEIFTDQVIQTLSQEKENLVFLLWGKFAQSKMPLIEAKKHLVLTAAHPSPFSAHNGFFGCRHFSRTNNFLIDKNKVPINWQII